MKIYEALKEVAHQPLTHQLLIDILKDYKRPNDKILTLKAEGLIEPIKRGLYIVGKSLGYERPENALLANHILGPSYLSSDSALSYYGLIPEKVFAITSMTIKASRNFQTTLGRFTYTNLPLPYYAFGINSLGVSHEEQVMIASPEKALCDKIVTTTGITFRSQSSAKDYVFGNLRMEEEEVANFNLSALISWLDHAPKRESLEMLIKIIEKL